MDRIITEKKNDYKLFKDFEKLDLFPYAIALVMIIGEIYMVIQFVSIIRPTF